MLSPAPSVQASNEARICHIANAGFLVAGNEGGVLIDAVMKRDDYNGRFSLPSPETLAAMQSGSGDFSNVKLALVTHRHGDHFDAGASLKHIRSDSEVEYVMPPEAFALIKKAGIDDVESERVHVVLPKWSDGGQFFKINGIKLEAFRIDHGLNMPQNIGYKVTLGNTSFFHTGDINASLVRLQNAGLDRIAVDYMMMPFWYAMQQKENIDTAWNLETMIGTHYHAKEQPWMTDSGGLEGLRRAVAETWPNSLRLDREMQCEKLVN